LNTTDVHVLAAGISGQTVGNWINDNIVGMLVAVIGATILVAAIKKNIRDASMTFVIAMIAFLFLVIGANWRAWGEWIQSTFFGG
jgi:uncharacterized membrane protein YqgA involved in biofilm formation